jgi:isoleucyl-tRNA synthetase
MGNTITPEEILKTMGADILRWWTASVDYNDDVRISKEILERSADAYRKIRNTLRFLLGALADFDPARDQVPESQWAPLDHWIWDSFSRLAGRVTESYRNYQYLDVAQSLHGFCQLDLSGRYFEIIKDRLYCDGEPSARRRSCRTVCWKLAQGLAVLLAPVLSFTADEVWENIPGAEGHVFEQRYPEGRAGSEPADWERFWEIREAVQGAMEPHRAAKTIGTSLDAQVRLILPEADSALLGRLGESAEDLLVVSGLTLESGPDLQVEVTTHARVKCPRCWNHKGGHGQGEDADLCPRCWDVFKGQA